MRNMKTWNRKLWHQAGKFFIIKFETIFSGMPSGLDYLLPANRISLDYLISYNEKAGIWRADTRAMEYKIEK